MLIAVTGHPAGPGARAFRNKSCPIEYASNLAVFLSHTFVSALPHLPPGEPSRRDSPLDLYTKYQRSMNRNPGNIIQRVCEQLIVGLAT